MTKRKPVQAGFFSLHNWAIVELSIPGIINDVRDHPEYSGCRIVTAIICWQRLPYPVLQINQVGLRVSSVSFDPEFPVDCAYQQ